MVEVAILDKHWTDQDGANRWDARYPLQFLKREVHVLQRQYRGGEQPLWRRPAEIDDPVVVGAGQRIGDVGVAHQKEAFGEPGRVEQRLVNTHRVHVGKARLRIRGALGGRMLEMRVESADR